MRLNSGQPASERREGVKPRLALIGGVEAGATIADIQTTASIEQLLPLNPANRRIRTRTYGGLGGEEPRGSPLSRLRLEQDYFLRPAAARIRSATSLGCDTSDRWPASSSTVVAFIRLARNRSRSGLMVWSCLETAYHDGFECQAATLVRPANSETAVGSCTA